MATGRIVVFLCVTAFFRAFPDRRSAAHYCLRTGASRGWPAGLPARYGDSITVLQGNGLIDSIRAYAPSFDVVAAASIMATMRPHAPRACHRRHHQSCAGQGYRRIWFLGNSMAVSARNLCVEASGRYRRHDSAGALYHVQRPVREIMKAAGWRRGQCRHR